MCNGTKCLFAPGHSDSDEGKEIEVYSWETPSGAPITVCKIPAGKKEEDQLEKLTKAHHENITKIFHYHKTEEKLYIFCERNTISISQFLAEISGPFDNYRILKYSQQLIRGLYDLHSNGVFHTNLNGKFE